MGFLVLRHSGNFYSEDHFVPGGFAFFLFFLILPSAPSQQIQWRVKHQEPKTCWVERGLWGSLHPLPCLTGAQSVFFIRHAAGLAELRVLWPYHV